MLIIILIVIAILLMLIAKTYLSLKKFFDVNKMRTVEKNVATVKKTTHSRSMTMAANRHSSILFSSSSSSSIFLVILRTSLRIAYKFFLNGLLLEKLASSKFKSDTLLFSRLSKNDWLLFVCLKRLFEKIVRVPVPTRPKSSLISSTFANKLFELKPFMSLAEFELNGIPLLLNIRSNELLSIDTRVIESFSFCCCSSFFCNGFSMSKSFASLPQIHFLIFKKKKRNMNFNFVMIVLLLWQQKFLYPFGHWLLNFNIFQMKYQHKNIGNNRKCTNNSDRGKINTFSK